MARYIDAEKLRERWLHEVTPEGGYCVNDILDSIDLAEDEPVVAVLPMTKEM